MIKELYKKVDDIIKNSKKALIIQADNPDADSLASSLAIESIFDEMNISTHLFCSIDMPNYLKYIVGWDRVENYIPQDFDMTIIVDTSSSELIKNLKNDPNSGLIYKKPLLVLDHHRETSNDIPNTDIVINDIESVSTGEAIYHMAKYLDWPLPKDALENIMTSILADSLGLTTINTTADTYIVMSEIIKAGIDRPSLEEQRRIHNKMTEKVFRYKARLIERTEIIENKIAVLVIPQEEINEYSPHYNPNALIQPEHMQTDNILVSIVIKQYDNGRVTGAIRSNLNAPIASVIAEKFGGGGHDHAAGFKKENVPDIDSLKENCIETALSLIESL